MARLLAAGLTIIYTLISLAGLGVLLRHEHVYPPSFVATDLLFTSIAVVLVIGLLRDHEWARLILLLLTGVRISWRLAVFAIGLYRTGLRAATLPQPMWLVRVGLLLAIAVCLLLPQHGPAADGAQ
jgi:hypothetical protein